MKVREDFSLLLSLYDCGESFKTFSANKLSLFFFPGVRATRVRMLRKEIALVRRKLNQEKRHLSESSGL